MAADFSKSLRTRERYQQPGTECSLLETDRRGDTHRNLSLPRLALVKRREKLKGKLLKSYFRHIHKGQNSH